jgi:hypothetical protein
LRGEQQFNRTSLKEPTARSEVVCGCAFPAHGQTSDCVVIRDGLTPLTEPGSQNFQRTVSTDSTSPKNAYEPLDPEHPRHLPASARFSRIEEGAISDQCLDLASSKLGQKVYWSQTVPERRVCWHTPLMLSSYYELNVRVFVTGPSSRCMGLSPDF